MSRKFTIKSMPSQRMTEDLEEVLKALRKLPDNDDVERILPFANSPTTTPWPQSAWLIAIVVLLVASLMIPSMFLVGAYMTDTSSLAELQAADRAYLQIRNILKEVTKEKLYTELFLFNKTTDKNKDAEAAQMLTQYARTTHAIMAAVPWLPGRCAEFAQFQSPEAFTDYLNQNRFDPTTLYRVQSYLSSSAFYAHVTDHLSDCLVASRSGDMEELVLPRHIVFMKLEQAYLKLIMYHTYCDVITHDSPIYLKENPHLIHATLVYAKEAIGLVNSVIKVYRINIGAYKDLYIIDPLAFARSINGSMPGIFDNHRAFRSSYNGSDDLDNFDDVVNDDTDGKKNCEERDFNYNCSNVNNGSMFNTTADVMKDSGEIGNDTVFGDYNATACKIKANRNGCSGMDADMEGDNNEDMDNRASDFSGVTQDTVSLNSGEENISDSEYDYNDGTLETDKNNYFYDKRYMSYGTPASGGNDTDFGVHSNILLSLITFSEILVMETGGGGIHSQLPCPKNSWEVEEAGTSLDLSISLITEELNGVADKLEKQRPVLAYTSLLSSVVSVFLALPLFLCMRCQANKRLKMLVIAEKTSEERNVMQREVLEELYLRTVPKCLMNTVQENYRPTSFGWKHEDDGQNAKEQNPDLNDGRPSSKEGTSYLKEACVLSVSLPDMKTVMEAASPTQFFNILSQLCNLLDERIQLYNVCVVQQRGFSLSVASGTQTSKVIDCVMEICNLALDLMSSCSDVEIPFTFDHKIRPKIGIHTAPCTGFIPGTKEIRTRLVGNVVPVAVEHREASFANSILVSARTANLLKPLVLYELVAREFLPEDPRLLNGASYLTGRADCTTEKQTGQNPAAEPRVTLDLVTRPKYSPVCISTM